KVESPAAGVRGLARRQSHLEKALTLDRQVERVASLAEIALALYDLRGGGARSQANLQASGNRGLLGRSCARHDHVLVNQIFKLQTPLAKSGGTRVGQIIGHVLQIHLLRAHPAGAGVQGSQHSSSSFKVSEFQGNFETCLVTLSAIRPQ